MRKLPLNRKRGSTTLLSLLFVMGFTVLGLGIVGLTAGQHANVGKSNGKQQANALAESALEVFYDQIRNQMVNETSYPFSLAQTSVSMPINGVTTTIGTYSARLINAREVQTDVTQGNDKLRRYSYTFKVEGTGTTASGMVSKIQATFVGDFYRNIVKKEVARVVTAPPGQIYFPVGALVSNTTVDITTDNGLRTYSPSGNDAHVIANEGMSWNTATGTKSSNSNPNVIDIQGQFLVPPLGPLQSTNGVNGLGNSNGITNFRNPGLAATTTFAGSPPNTVLSMSGPVNFANESTVDGWATKWRTRATATDSLTWEGTVNNDNIPKREGDQWQIISAPCTITGDLVVQQGKQIRLMPKSTNPVDNVVYVKGNVINKGQLLNLGCTLVFEGKYTDTKDAQYKVDPQGSPFTTRELVLMRSAFISLNQSKDAITWSSDASCSPGLVYSTKGGIRITGSNAELSGLLLAGGTGANGGIDIRPGGGASFTVRYEPYAATGGALTLDSASKIDYEYVPGNVCKAFSPGKPFNWNWLR